MSCDLFSKKEIIERYLKEERNSLSSYSFVSLYAWKDFFEFNVEIINDCLCIFAKNEQGSFLYLPPLGRNISDKVIEECFARMEQANQGSGVTRIENVDSRYLHLFQAFLK